MSRRSSTHRSDSYDSSEHDSTSSTRRSNDDDSTDASSTRRSNDDDSTSTSNSGDSDDGSTPSFGERFDTFMETAGEYQPVLESLTGLAEQDGGLLLDYGPGSELRKQAEAIAERADKVDEAKRNLAGGGSVPNSDALLDDGAVGLEFFKQFLPMYTKWKGDGPEFEQLKKRYDEFRGIDFAAFRKDAEMLDKVQQELLAQNDSMGKAFDSAKQTWQGDAADSAGAKVGEFSRAGTTVTNETEKFGGAIGPTMDGITDAVREYAKFVVDIGGKLQCAGKSPDEVANEIRKAQGNLIPEDLNDVGMDGLFDAATSYLKGTVETFICTLGMAGPLAPFPGLVNAGKSIRDGLIDDAKKWLDGSFVPEMQNKHNQFEQQTDSTVRTIEQAYQKLLKEGKVTEDPFAGIAEDDSTRSASANGTDKTGGADKTGGSPTGGGGGSPTGGGGAPSGGGAPAGGGGGMPGGGTPGGSAPGGGAGAAPPTPNPAENLPKPPGAQDAEKPQEITLGEGAESVSLREPKPDGTVEVEMLGADGQPKKYAVELGPDGGSGPDEQGKPGQAPEGSRGGDGPGGPRDNGADPIPVRPGEDGKAVIEEGDRTITLERTPEGRMAVSVDNGGGEPPTQQTVNFGEDSGGPRPDMSPGGGPHHDGAGAGGADSAPGHGPGAQVRPEHAPPSPAAQEQPGHGTPAQGTPGHGPMSQGPAAPGGGAFDQPAAADGGPGGSGGPSATTPQSATLGSMFSANAGANVGSIAGDLFGGSGPESDAAQPGAGNATDAGGANHGMSGHDKQAGSGPGASAAGGGGGSGGGMMGGMGMMGGGMGQQGGDQERTNDSPWRTEGNLFDDGIPQSNVRYRSVIGEHDKKKE